MVVAKGIGTCQWRRSVSLGQGGGMGCPTLSLSRLVTGTPEGEATLRQFFGVGVGVEP